MTKDRNLDSLRLRRVIIVCGNETAQIAGKASATQLSAESGYLFCSRIMMFRLKSEKARYRTRERISFNAREKKSTCKRP